MGRPGQHLSLGGDSNASFHGLTDFHHVGESIPRSRTLLDTNDSLCARALPHCCGRAGLDGDEHLDGRGLRTRAIYTLHLVGPPPEALTQTGLHHVFKEIRNETRASAGLRLVQDTSQGGVCCSCTENESEERCELWLEAIRFLVKSGCRYVDRLWKLECDGASAVGNGKVTQKIGIPSSNRL